MAEVLQPLHQPSSTITMLQPRPASAGAFDGSNAAQVYQQSQRAGHTPRGAYNGSYRGTSAVPVQPYAFQATPHLRQETRTISAPPAQNAWQLSPSSANHTKLANPASSNASTTSSGTSPANSIIGRPSPSGTDAIDQRPNSIISLSSSIPDLSLTNFDSTPKASPERYRRTTRRTDSFGPNSPGAGPQQQVQPAAPSGSGMSAVEHLYIPPPAPLVRTASDDMQAQKSTEAAKRYRRRSLGNLDSATTPAPSSQVQRPNSQGGAQAHVKTPSSGSRPGSFHEGAERISVGGTVTPPVSAKHHLLLLQHSDLTSLCSLRQSKTLLAVSNHRTDLPLNKIALTQALSKLVPEARLKPTSIGLHPHHFLKRRPQAMPKLHRRLLRRPSSHPNVPTHR